MHYQNLFVLKSKTFLHDDLSEFSKAAQYGESLPSMVDDMNTMGSSVEVKQRLGSAVENLDILAYAGLDQLKQRCLNLRSTIQGIVL